MANCLNCTFRLYMITLFSNLIEIYMQIIKDTYTDRFDGWKDEWVDGWMDE